MLLVKDNVEREATTEREIALLKKKGFVEVKKKEDSIEAGTDSEVDSNGEADSINLDAMSLKDLKGLAKEKGLEGVSSLNKEQLLEVLKGQNNG